jgi:hypothetical protein
VSEVARIGIVTTLFAVLLSIGSAVGIGFYFNTLPQPDRSDLSHLSPNLARSDKTDSVFDIRQRLGPEGRSHPSDKPAMTEPASMPDLQAAPLPAVEEPNFEPSATTEEAQPAPTDPITAPAEPDLTATAEPDLTATAPPKIEQRAAAPSGTVGLGTATPSKAVRRPSEPCRSEGCRQALAECSKLCDAAMTLSVAACPRASSGASEKDETACLAKWDRRRRDCHSGCALRQSRALKTP